MKTFQRLVVFVLLLTLLVHTRLSDRVAAQGTAPGTTSTSQLFLPLVLHQSALDLPPAAELAASRNGATRDRPDLLLLYDGQRLSDFDQWFSRIAEYYGLTVAKVDVRTTPLTLTQFKDSAGLYFNLIGVSADTLQPSYFDVNEQGLLKDLIHTQGVTLFVGKVRPTTDLTLLKLWTNGDLAGLRQPQDSRRDWTVTRTAPAVTQTFSGLVISSPRSLLQADYALLATRANVLEPLITSADNARQSYTIFARWRTPTAAIYLDAGMTTGPLAATALTTHYFTLDNFTTVIPLMMVISSLYSEEVWHNPVHYANFMIDDPALLALNHLKPMWRAMDYIGLLPEMEVHNFHTTIAWQPKHWQTWDAAIVQLFVEHPARFSIAQHGNNHDGFEFYKYTATPQDPFPARPYAEQVADILQGMERMDAHEQLTGIDYDPLMIFPYGNGPASVLEVLKAHNYLATVQRPVTPLSASPSSRWDFNMRPANLDFYNFPLVERIAVEMPRDYSHLVTAQLLFLDRPVLLFSHPKFFTAGINAFNPIADQINQLDPAIQWRTLGTILQQMYLQKRNDDGSIEVMMQVNQLRLTNPANQQQLYHLWKEELGNVPIERVTINNCPATYSLRNGLLTLDLQVADHATVDVVITYRSSGFVTAPLEPALVVTAATATAAALTAAYDEDDPWADQMTIFLPLINR